MPEKQSRKKIELEMQREQALFEDVVGKKIWEDLTSKKFPLLAEVQGRPFYIMRLGIINEQIHLIADSAAVGDEEGVGKARGVLAVLSKAATETITFLYPNVKLVEEESVLTVEELEKIEDFVQRGVVERLTDELPGWKDLEPERRLLYRLEALQIFYSSWQSREDDDSLSEINPVGFNTSGSKNTISRIKRAVQVAQEKIIARHLEEWLKEADATGLGEDNEMVKAARKLQENK